MSLFCLFLKGEKVCEISDTSYKSLSPCPHTPPPLPWSHYSFHFNFSPFYRKTKCQEPCAVARLEACLLGMQAAPSSIPTSSTFFHGDLVMKTFLRPFSLFHLFKKSSCQLLAKECALNSGKLPRRLAQEQHG